MTGQRSLYEVLGVPADAGTEQIRRAFRARARAAHPDAGGDPAAFRRLQEAYEVLRDPVRRQDHDDRLGIRRGGPPGGVSGWAGRAGSFTGDVEFPDYLRDVVAAPWTAGDAAETARPADVSWWWPHQSAHPPVPAGGGAVVVLAGRQRLAAVDVASGQERWSSAVPASLVSCPLPIGDRLVVSGASAPDAVEAHGLDDGRLVWRAALGASVTAVPVAGGGRVLVGTERGLTALDAADGSAVWSTRLPSPATTVTLAAGMAVVTAARGTLHSLDVGRGKQRWWVRASPSVDVAPVAATGGVWIVAGAGRLARLDPSTGAVSVQLPVGAAVAGLVGDERRLTVSAAGPARLLQLDATGATRWSVELPAVAGEPGLAPAHVVVGTRLGSLVAVDRRTGWAAGSAALPFVPSGPPTVVADRVVVADREGTVWAVAAPLGAGW